MTQCIQCQSWPWPLTPWLKINRVPPLFMNKLHVKFESDPMKSCPQGKAWWTNRPTNSLTQPHMNGRITLSPPTLLRGDNEGVTRCFCETPCPRRQQSLNNIIHIFTMKVTVKVTDLGVMRSMHASIKSLSPLVQVTTKIDNRQDKHKLPLIIPLRGNEKEMIHIKFSYMRIRSLDTCILQIEWVLNLDITGGQSYEWKWNGWPLPPKINKEKNQCVYVLINK